MPLIHNVFLAEESEEAKIPGTTTTFIARHIDVIQIYAWFFIGLIISFAMLYTLLPIEMRTNAFKEQINEYCIITGSNAEQCQYLNATKTGSITGNATGGGYGVGYLECKNPVTKNIPGCTYFIFQNNLMVLLLAIILSFVYGAGAIFLISWNASVIGVFIGESIIQGGQTTLNMIIGLWPHGIPEILSYFFGAIAGAIASTLVSKKKYLSGEVETIVKDITILLGLAVISVLIGSIIESMFFFNENQESSLGIIIAIGYLIGLFLIVMNGKKEMLKEKFKKEQLQF